MAVTYIVTTHNRQALLERALDAICAERCTESELIVVDDGSLPPATIPDRVETTFGGVTLLRTPTNLGVIGARNYGLAQARHEYVLFLDDDDESLPNRTRDLLQEIEKTGADFVAARSYFMNGNRQTIVPTAGRQAQTFETVLLYPAHIDAVIWRKSMLERQNGLDNRVPYLGEHISLAICMLRGGTGMLSEALVARFGYIEAGLTHRAQQDRFLQRQLIAMFETLADESAATPIYKEQCKKVLDGLQRQDIEDFDAYLSLLPGWLNA